MTPTITISIDDDRVLLEWEPPTSKVTLYGMLQAAVEILMRYDEPQEAVDIGKQAAKWRLIRGGKK